MFSALIHKKQLLVQNYIEQFLFQECQDTLSQSHVITQTQEHHKTQEHHIQSENKPQISQKHAQICKQSSFRRIELLALKLSQQKLQSPPVFAQILNDLKYLIVYFGHGSSRWKIQLPLHQNVTFFRLFPLKGSIMIGFTTAQIFKYEVKNKQAQWTQKHIQINSAKLYYDQKIYSANFLIQSFRFLLQRIILVRKIQKDSKVSFQIQKDKSLQEKNIQQQRQNVKQSASLQLLQELQPLIYDLKTFSYDEDYSFVPAVIQSPQGKKSRYQCPIISCAQPFSNFRFFKKHMRSHPQLDYYAIKMDKTGNFQYENYAINAVWLIAKVFPVQLSYFLKTNRQKFYPENKYQEKEKREPKNTKKTQQSGKDSDKRKKKTKKDVSQSNLSQSASQITQKCSYVSSQVNIQQNNE